jgi:hypothetical protein
MAAEVYMDVPACESIANTLGTVGDVLDTVAKVLEALSMTLKTTAFIGLVGGIVVAQYIDAVRPHIQEMSDKCKELDQDVKASIQRFQTGDQTIAARFG